MSKPAAVVIADVHYNIHTLPLADAAMRAAIAKANSLEVPLIVAGDLHDTKANMRAECVNTMIETFSQCKTGCFILRGNHDQINEKAEEHALNFLGRSNVRIIDRTGYYNEVCDKFDLIPYHHDVEELRKYLKTVSTGRTIIMHQGLTGSASGEYIRDNSAINYEDVKDFRVISGHYHTRQDIKTGRPQKGAVGLFSYIGNPYTLNFAEAKDPEKGFQILMDDGTLEFVPTNLRKHVVIEIDLNEPGQKNPWYNQGDLLLVKVKGTKEQLLSFKKESLGISIPFRLDLIPTSTDIETPSDTKNNTAETILDSLIDSLPATSEQRKVRLKELWRKSASN
jgi:DNA repair exonuclease SbcCD nuclease subunit